MSSKNEQKWFEIDENGKIKALPLYLSNPEQVHENRSATKSVRGRQCIQKEKFELSVVEESNPKTKVRVIEKSIRKELFKVPERARNKKQNAQSFAGRNFTKSRASQKHFQDITPLADIVDMCEEASATKIATKPKPGYQFELLSKPIINFVKPDKDTAIFECRNKTETLINSKLQTQTTDDFLELEKICATPKTVAASPLTAVCNMLGRTKLSNTKPEKLPDTKNSRVHTNLLNYVHDIQNILAEEEESFRYLQNQFESYSKSRAERNSKIAQLLQNIQEFEKENNENIPTNRRSGRLAAKVEISKSESKLITSPLISKGMDLRKTTLTKNFVKNVQDETKSPRLAKAVETYNMMRNEFSVLSTPKLTRNNSDSPKSQTSSRSLSKRLQKQCLLLQETPCHK